MKTVFIINPMAGKKNNIEKLVQKINKVKERLCAQVEIYITSAVGDAERFAREYCKNHGPARFIACGGDGTIGEVLNGIMDFDTAQMGAFPIGTGNDFVKNFDGDFLDVEAQILSPAEKCDIIKYVSEDKNGRKKSGYCANMFNIGFDCNVADAMTQFKKKPFVSGSLAYFLAIFTTLAGKKGADIEIELDGKSIHKGQLLLTSVANGKFCGGGIKSNPCACVHDGLMNVNIIYNVSRLEFIKLLPYYMNGTHLSVAGIDRIINCISCKKLTIKPHSETMRICIDGEITSSGKITFEALCDAANFVVPHKALSGVSEKQPVNP